MYDLGSSVKSIINTHSLIQSYNNNHTQSVPLLNQEEYKQRYSIHTNHGINHDHHPPAAVAASQGVNQ